MNYLKVDLQAGVFLLLLVVVLPTIIVLCSEHFLHKQGGYKITLITLGLTFLLTLVFYFNIERSRILVTDTAIELQNFFYSRTIPIEKINTVELYDELPVELSPRLKTNGLAIGSVKIGSFLLKDRKTVFFMSAQPPFNVITLGDDKFIFSTNKEINEKLTTRKTTQ